LPPTALSTRFRKYSSTVLSNRIEIFVLPGSGLTTGPRFAREKSMLRYLSATTFFIRLPLTLVRLPRGDHADDVRLHVCVYDNQQLRQIAQAQRHKPLLLDSIGILLSKGEGVFQDCDRLRLPRIPLEPHHGIV